MVKLLFYTMQVAKQCQAFPSATPIHLYYGSFCDTLGLHKRGFMPTSYNLNFFLVGPVFNVRGRGPAVWRPRLH
jgi:hypothetical protein